MPDAAIDLQIKDQIAYLTLDCPPGNQMGIGFFRQLSEMNRHVFPFIKVKGMIISGRGRHFSSGAYVEEIQSCCRDENGKRALLEHSNCFGALEQLPFPVIAAVRGCCIGNGLELAMSCRYLIAAERSVFSLPEVTFGLIPGCGGTVRLPERIGSGPALELLLSGRTMLAEEALEVGLVDYVVRGVELIARAEHLLGRLSGAGL